MLGVTLAKMAAGASILGPIGALGGLVAGIIEAAPIAKAIGKDQGPPNIDPSTTTPPDGKMKDPKDKFKTKSTEPQKYIMVSPDPQAISANDVVLLLTFDGVIETTKAWSPESFEPIDRSAERFWPLHNAARSKGYVGRWGVRCATDPFNRRAGDILPDDRVEVLRSLMQYIAP